MGRGFLGKVFNPIHVGLGKVLVAACVGGSFTFVVPTSFSVTEAVDNFLGRISFLLKVSKVGAYLFPIQVNSIIPNASPRFGMLEATLNVICKAPR